MNIGSFDRETLLDLVVNAIPLAMMAFFIVVFAVFNPFGSDPANTAIQFSIVIVTFGALLLLTYYSARAISRAEEELEEADPDEYVEPDAGAANLNEAVVGETDDTDEVADGGDTDDEESADEESAS